MKNPKQSPYLENLVKLLPITPFLLILSYFIFLTSCTSVYYVPNTQSVPLFEHKNQGVVTGGLEIGKHSFGADVQAAVSITDNIALSTNLFYGAVENKLMSNTGGSWWGEASGGTVPYRNFELGIGYFTNLGSSRGIFEVYGGWGIGGTKFLEQPITDFYRFNHFFIQPNIGGHLGKVDLAFSTRLNYGVWSDFTYAFIEPALTFRVGKKVKFQLQVLGSFDIYTDFETQVSAFKGTNKEQVHSSWGIFIPLDFRAKSK